MLQMACPMVPAVAVAVAVLVGNLILLGGACVVAAAEVAAALGDVKVLVVQVAVLEELLSRFY